MKRCSTSAHTEEKPKWFITTYLPKWIKVKNESDNTKYWWGCETIEILSLVYRKANEYNTLENG